MKPLRTYLGLAASAGLIFLGLWALFSLIRFGSCASGGVYVSQRECAPGTGLKIIELMASIFGTLATLAIAAAGGPRALMAACGLIPGFVASYFYVIAFAPTLGAGAKSSDAGPALIAGAVCTLIALPFLYGAIRPGSRRARTDQIVVNSPTGLAHIHKPEAGGPALVVRAINRPND